MFSRIATAALFSSLAFSQTKAVLQPYTYPLPPTQIGVFVTPISGVPFSATVLSESTRTFQNGSTNNLKSCANIARDSAGRIYNEQRTLIPNASKETPSLLSAHIFDPQTRLSTFVLLGRKLARQSTVSHTESQQLPPWWDNIGTSDPLLKKEDLGTAIMENVPVRGVRITRTFVPSAETSNQSVVIVDEYWYSDELKMNILTKNTDPRTGRQTVQLQNVKRMEPDPTLFQVPHGFKIVDENPPN